MNLQETKIGEKNKIFQKEIEIKFILARKKKKQIKDKNRENKKINKINKK
jgi:hypothetical protein